MTFPRRVTVLLAGAAVIGLAACGSGSTPSGTGATAAAGTATGGTATGGQIIVGSANFPESVLLAQIYAGALRAKGITVSTRLNIGSREVYLPAVKDGSIDVIPEYTGNLLAALDPTATAVTAAEVEAALGTALPASLMVLRPAAAADQDSIVVTRETAAQYHLQSIADLAPVAGSLTLGAPPEFETRPYGLPGLKRVYGVTFGRFRKLDAGGPLTVAALKNGQVQAADIFSTDPSIAANGWVVLADPKSLFTAQNVVPLINRAKASPAVTAALDAVSAKLDTPALTALVAQVVTDRKDPAAVAASWLTASGLT